MSNAILKKLDRIIADMDIDTELDILAAEKEKKEFKIENTNLTIWKLIMNC